MQKSSCKEKITLQYYKKHTTQSRKYNLMTFLLHVINQQLKLRNTSFQLLPSSMDRCV